MQDPGPSPVPPLPALCPNAWCTAGLFCFFFFLLHIADWLSGAKGVKSPLVEPHYIDVPPACSRIRRITVTDTPLLKNQYQLSDESS